MPKNELIDKINKIKLIISDVDGILTDGTISINDNGSENKNFNVDDGLGVSLAKLANIPVALLSGRFSKSTEIRAKELKIEKCIQGELNKLKGYHEILSYYNVNSNETCYIGDGLIDIGPMEISGLSISVPNAHRIAKENADYITKNKGGEGVLTEVVEFILIKKKIYHSTLQIMKNKVYNK